MDDYLKEAIEIAKAQASVREMNETQITEYIKKISQNLRAIEHSSESKSVDIMEAKKSIREKSVVCLECGKAFKMLTKRHLATHGLSPKDYREKYGLKRGASLTCKDLQKTRRAKMHDMKLWTRKGKGKKNK